MTQPCRNCGYDLSGIPHPGGVATCPEGATANPVPPPPIGPLRDQRLAAAVLILTPFFAAAVATFLSSRIPANHRLGTPLQIAMIVAIGWTIGAATLLVLSPIHKHIEPRRFKKALLAAILLLLLAPAIDALVFVTWLVLSLRASPLPGT